MVKVFKPKYLSPSEILDQVHKSGVIDYLFSWSYSIDEGRQLITFNLRYTGGEDDKKEMQMMKELEGFISSIDINVDGSK